ARPGWVSACQEAACLFFFLNDEGADGPGDAKRFSQQEAQDGDSGGMNHRRHGEEREENAVAHEHHLIAILPTAGAERKSRKSRSGVTGSSLISTPSGASASAMALATAAGAPMVPPSPTPLKPPSVVGEGWSRWITSMGGTSPAVG